MAAAYGAPLGSNAAFVQGGTTNTLSITTSAAAPADCRIVVVSYLWDGGATRAARVSSVSDGAAYARDGQFPDGDDVVDIWSRNPSAGLALSSTITATITVDQAFVPTGAWFLSAFYLTGVDTSAGAAEASTSQNGSGAAWSTGAVSNITADAIYVGANGYEDPTAGTNNASMTTGTEIHDLYNTTAQQGLVTAHLPVSSVASRAIAGNLSNAGSTLNAGLVVVYRGVAGVSGSSSASGPGRAGLFTPQLRQDAWF